MNISKNLPKMMINLKNPLESFLNFEILEWRGRSVLEGVWEIFVNVCVFAYGREQEREGDEETLR